MEALVEVNNEAELKLALEIGSKVVGVNNRNLHTFNVDMSTSSRMASLLPEDSGVILAALSGIQSCADVEFYRRSGVRAVLVGEALMRADNKQSFITDLLRL